MTREEANEIIWARGWGMSVDCFNGDITFGNGKGCKVAYRESTGDVTIDLAQPVTVQELEAVAVSLGFAILDRQTQAAPARMLYELVRDVLALNEIPLIGAAIVLPTWPEYSSKITSKQMARWVRLAREFTENLRTNETK